MYNVNITIIDLIHNALVFVIDGFVLMKSFSV